MILERVVEWIQNPELVQWIQKPEVVWGLFIAAVSGWFTLHQRCLARRARAADLFDRFYSPESYHAMVAPVFTISLRWNALQGERRREYARTLCKGWMGRDRAAEVIAAYDPELGSHAKETPANEFDAAHFRHARSTEVITEHAALTSFLYFWVKLEAMIDQGLVSKKLARRLFCQPYNIYGQFIADFRKAVTGVLGKEAYWPSWVKATCRLEKLLLDKPPTPEPIDCSSLGPGHGGVET